jgi:hypothetical protein
MNTKGSKSYVMCIPIIRSIILSETEYDCLNILDFIKIWPKEKLSM